MYWASHVSFLIQDSSFTNYFNLFGRCEKIDTEADKKMDGIYNQTFSFPIYLRNVQETLRK